MQSSYGLAKHQPQKTCFICFRLSQPQDQTFDSENHQYFPPFPVIFIIYFYHPSCQLIIEVNSFQKCCRCEYLGDKSSLERSVAPLGATCNGFNQSFKVFKCWCQMLIYLYCTCLFIHSLTEDLQIVGLNRILFAIGYLMSSQSHMPHAATYECVDENAKCVNAGVGLSGAATFTPVRTRSVSAGSSSGFLNCPPYSKHKALRCVVCTK